MLPSVAYHHDRPEDVFWKDRQGPSKSRQFEYRCILTHMLISEDTSDNVLQTTMIFVDLFVHCMLWKWSFDTYFFTKRPLYEIVISQTTLTLIEADWYLFMSIKSYFIFHIVCYLLVQLFNSYQYGIQI